MPRFSNNKRLLVLLVSLIGLTVIVSFSIKREQLTWPEKLLLDAVSSVQKLIYQPVAHIAGFVDEVQQIRALYEENTILKANLRDYNMLSARLAELEQRNKQLEAALNFKEHSKFTMFAANVTGRSTDWNSSITIDKGAKDGVRKDMAVIAPDGGLVGRVMSVADHNSTVSLITDTNGPGISAMEVSSRAVGIVSGSSSQLGAVEMSLVNREVNLQPGQKVVTSYLSDVFPAGIPIGEIVDRAPENSGLTQKATIKPAAKLDRLEIVFVVQRESAAGGGR
ncbi:rod shape-determining protein MreC [Effusibacillus pohliae]|uniref:rod shape-determining protein MreC n=1 Tax=Effusibacillus pohliae TaxID=232270 RepID=UPI00035D7FB1|nr:rod shape-determining protein MreC [Effusibacillus pohliae]